MMLMAEMFFSEIKRLWYYWLGNGRLHDKPISCLARVGKDGVI